MINLFLGEAKRTWISTKRYLFGALTDLVFYYILFMIVFFYTKNLNLGSTEMLNTEITKLIVGYMSWFFFSFTISFISNGLYSEMITGTFEQLYLTGTSLEGIMLVRFVVFSIKNIVTMILFTIILVVSTGVRLNLNIQMIWVFLILIIGIIGIAYILGGLTIRFKNTGQLAFIISTIFLGTSLINLDYSSTILEKLSYLIPFIKGQDLLKQLAVDSFAVSMNTYIVLIFNAFLYLVSGLIIFRVLLNQTRSKGILIRY